MKILIISNDSNGLFLFRRHLISELIRIGNTVDILTPFDTDVDELSKLGASLFQISIDKRGTSVIRDFSLLKKIYSFIKKCKPDLVLTYTIKPNIYGGLVCRLLKKSYVCNITGLGSSFEKGLLLKKCVSLLYRIALKKSKAVLFENAENLDFFVEQRIICKSKAHLLNGAGVDSNWFYYQPYPHNKVFNFLFIGRVMKEKGIDELIGSMRLLKNSNLNCSLTILGYCEEKYQETLTEAEREGLLRYCGHQNDVRPAINECDCFVLPSYHEGMANTLLECASSGRPIITTDIAGCREAVINGKTGYLCKARNTESLYNVMKSMYYLNCDCRKQMGIEAREYVKTRFEKMTVVNDTIPFLL